jgi:drug/metabolite transporter (DMT)-like permease
VQPRNKAYLQLHVAVFLFGFTAILGELIELHQMVLVWYRMLITTASLFFLPRLIEKLKKVKAKDLKFLAFIGILVSLHWVTFFGSIKHSTVSVALSCFATTAFFTSILEPVLLKKPFRIYELFLGVFVIAGIYLIFHFTEIYTYGIVLGLISALLATIFSILNKKMISQHDAFAITFVELGSGWIFLCALMPFFLFSTPDVKLIPSTHDWMYLVILALLCTTLGYVLALSALKQLTAFITNLTINLEPIYGIILAIIIFQEHKNLHPGFYVGSAVIVFSVFLHPFLHRWFGK